MRTLLLLLLLILVFITTGCQTNRTIFNEADPILTTIRDDTDKIKQSLTILRQIQQSDHPPQSLYAYQRPTSGPLTFNLSLEWSGDAEKALRRIALNIGFKVKTSGRKPINLNQVILHSGLKPAIEIIEDIGWQAGAGMGVLVNNEQQLIHIVYARQNG